MDWFLLTILSAASFSIATLLQRVLMKEEDSDPAAYVIVSQLLISAIAFAFALINGFSLAGIEKVIPNIILMTAIYASRNILFFKALKTTEASEISVLNSSSSVWATLGAILFLGEILTGQTIFAIFLVILGVVAVSYQKSFTLKKGHLLALMSALLFGFGIANDTLIIKHMDVASYIALDFFLPPLAIILLYPNSIKSMKPIFEKSKLTKMALLAIFYSAAVLLLFIAIKVGGPLSQVYPISQISIILTVALGAIFLKERSNLVRKFLGALLVIAGVILLR